MDENSGKMNVFSLRPRSHFDLILKCLQNSVTRHDHTYCIPPEKWPEGFSPPPSEAVLRCKQCPFHTGNVVFLNRHILQVHIRGERPARGVLLEDFKNLQCENCGFKSVNHRVHKTHLNQCKALAKKSQAFFKWYKCPKCSFKTEQPKELKTHYCDILNNN